MRTRGIDHHLVQDLASRGLMAGCADEHEPAERSGHRRHLGGHEPAEAEPDQVSLASPSRVSACRSRIARSRGSRAHSGRSDWP